MICTSPTKTGSMMKVTSASYGKPLCAPGHTVASLLSMEAAATNIAPQRRHAGPAISYTPAGSVAMQQGAHAELKFQGSRGALKHV